MAEFRINISNLSEGTHEYSLETEPSKIGLDERFSDKIKVIVKLEKSSQQILLQANIDTGAVFTCDRCLDNFEKQLRAVYSLVYVIDNRSMLGVKKEEEIHILSADTNCIDLDEDVRQYTLLAIPPKLLCIEDCKGLCPVCGINKNHETCSCNSQEFNSRWDTLKELPYK